MEKNKYYTPEIEEINIKPGDKVLMLYGDEPEEVEVREITHDVRGYDPFTFKDTENLVCRIGDIVIKYLDEEDIESLGFEYYESKGNTHFTYNVLIPEFRGRKNKWLQIIHVPHSNWCVIFISDTKEGVDEAICFTGTIKNKSELKRILKMIGYEDIN